MSTNRTRRAFAPDYIVPPGASLRDAMEQMSMTPASLAAGLDMTVQSLNRIFNGEEAISPETAARLEMVMGIPARFWNSLQTHYAASLTKQEEEEHLAEEMQA